jgi:hypothetical protein
LCHSKWTWTRRQGCAVFLETEASEDLEAVDKALSKLAAEDPEGRAGQAPLLRRPDHARDRPGARVSRTEDNEGNSKTAAIPKNLEFFLKRNEGFRERLSH